MMRLFALISALMVFASSIYAQDDCDTFLDETMSPRYELRLQQYEGFDPIVRAFAGSLNGRDLQIPRRYSDEIKKSRFGSYVHQIVSRKTGMRAGKPLYPSPMYFPGIPRGTEEEILNSGLFHYMKGSGNGNSHFKSLVEAHMHKATHYLFRLDDKEETSFSLIPTPVGEYSPDFYRKLLLTTGIILSLSLEVYPELKPALEEADLGDFSFARKELDAGALGFAFEGIRDKPAFYAFQEGIVSLHQLLVLLTINEVEGVSGDELIGKLLSPRSQRGDTLASVYSRMLPMGLMGPMILRGDLFENPVRKNSEGQIVPTEDFKIFLQQAKDRLLDRIKKLPYVTRGSCRGCPMVHSADREKTSAIDVLAGIYLQIFNQVSELEAQ